MHLLWGGRNEWVKSMKTGDKVLIKKYNTLGVFIKHHSLCNGYSLVVVYRNVEEHSGTCISFYRPDDCKVLSDKEYFMLKLKYAPINTIKTVDGVIPFDDISIEKVLSTFPFSAMHPAYIKHPYTIETHTEIMEILRRANIPIIDTTSQVLKAHQMFLIAVSESFKTYIP